MASAFIQWQESQTRKARAVAMGVNVDSIGYMYQFGDADNITKLEGKITDSAKGPGKSWNKFGADQVTVEFELRALGGCD